MDNMDSAIQQWREQHLERTASIAVVYVDRRNFGRNATPDSALVNCQEKVIWAGHAATFEYEFMIHDLFHRHLMNKNYFEASKCLLFYIPELSTKGEVCYASRHNFFLIRGVYPIVDRTLICIGCFNNKEILTGRVF